jgi:hypothetical protein
MLAMNPNKIFLNAQGWRLNSMKIGGLRVLVSAATRWGVVRPSALVAAALAPLVFCAPALAVERSLAGIKIFSSSKTVLQKFKSPTRVIVGRPSLVPPDATGTAAAPGAAPAAAGTGPGQLPPMGGGVPSEFGGAPAPSPATGAPTTGAADPNALPNGANPGEVTWIYTKPNGSDLEFTFSADGRVIQIRATGYTGTVRTAKGIALGQSYGTVIAKYGFPENQDQQGAILNARYTDKDHVAFQFYNQKLVAIIVAAVE